MDKEMNTLRISDDIHRKVTATVGTLMAQTGKMQTYQDAIEALLRQSVILPPKFLERVEDFIEENKHLSFTTREEFIRDAIRFRLEWHSGKYEYIKIPKEQYEQLDEAVKKTSTPYRSAKEFINARINEVIEKYAEWRRTKKRH
jgi:metal-responsive CopG/Arc/MetJ family transcriptional regulator